MRAMIMIMMVVYWIERRKNIHEETNTKCVCQTNNELTSDNRLGFSSALDSVSGSGTLWEDAKRKTPARRFWLGAGRAGSRTSAAIGVAKPVVLLLASWAKRR
jgi:hypothetical protein